MASTGERVDSALSILRDRGHDVRTNPGVSVGADGRMRLIVDGEPRTFDEIFEMTTTPNDVYTFFDANRATLGYLGIFYEEGRVMYAVQREAEKPEKRQQVPGQESAGELAERIKRALGAVRYLKTHLRA